MEIPIKYGYSFIGNGSNNHICSSSNYSVITGGYNNTLSATYSVILGGRGNCVCSTAASSAVLGGLGNTVSHCYSAVFGCGVSSTMACAFHTNQMVLFNLQCCSTGISGLSTGAVYVDDLTWSPNRVLVLY